MNKKEQLWEKWWFWVTLAVLIMFILFINLGNNYNRNYDTMCYDDRELVEVYCEYSNELIELVNDYQDVLQGAYPDTDLEVEYMDKISCSEIY